MHKILDLAYEMANQNIPHEVYFDADMLIYPYHRENAEPDVIVYEHGSALCAIDGWTGEIVCESEDFFDVFHVIMEIYYGEI